MDNIARQRPNLIARLARWISPSFVTPDPTRVFGMDISHWDGPVDMVKSKAGGISFVIIKMFDGTVPSNYGLENRQRAIDAGMPYAYYCWLYPSNKVSGTAQARAWADLPAGAFKTFVDYEWTTYAGQPANPYESDLYGVLTRFLEYTGKRMGIYTSAGYCGDHPLKIYEKDFDDWLAHYGTINPAIPSPWTDWVFHQFTDQGDGSLYGVNPAYARAVDLNYFNGTRDQFNTYIGGAIIPPPPGENMKYKITPKSTFVNIRSDHSTTSTDIGDLLPAHFAEGDVLWMSGTIGTSNYQLWLNIQTLDGVAKSGWCAVWYQGTELCAMTENTPPPPPAETVVKVNLSAVVDGATYVPGSIAGNEVTMKKA